MPLGGWPAFAERVCDPAVDTGKPPGCAALPARRRMAPAETRLNDAHAKGAAGVERGKRCWIIATHSNSPLRSPGIEALKTGCDPVTGHDQETIVRLSVRGPKICKHD